MAEYRGRDLPGAVRVTGKAGDMVMFSETLLHTGATKSSSRQRTNLYFNYIDATYNPAMRELLAGESRQCESLRVPTSGALSLRRDSARAYGVDGVAAHGTGVERLKQAINRR